jgi:hypothetical protein
LNDESRRRVALVEEVAKHIGDIATGANGKDGVSVTGAVVTEQAD